MAKKLKTVVIILVAALILISLIKQISESLNISQRLEGQVEEVARLQEENKRLKKRLEEVLELEFIEEVARNKLNLSRPNETVVVIPLETINQVIASNKELEEPKLPNWQGWLRLFFN